MEKWFNEACYLPSHRSKAKLCSRWASMMDFAGSVFYWEVLEQYCRSPRMDPETRKRVQRDAEIFQRPFIKRPRIDGQPSLPPHVQPRRPTIDTSTAASLPIWPPSHNHADARGRVPDPSVKAWRSAFVIRLTDTYLPVTAIAELVMDFLVPFFVHLTKLVISRPTTPHKLAESEELHGTTDYNIITNFGSHEPVVYRIATLGTLPAVSNDCSIQHIRILLVAQPFNECEGHLNFGNKDPFDWGIDRCALPSQVVSTFKNSNHWLRDCQREAHELRQIRTPESTYQTRIILYAQHHPRDRGEYGITCPPYPDPLISLPLPLPPLITHSFITDPRWSLSHPCKCPRASHITDALPASLGQNSGRSKIQFLC